ncbi:MAG: methionine gamma-lyase family protein [Clostridia bacterium]|nr:methionine gamma-lyase family protein [Clostridia bacterium]
MDKLVQEVENEIQEEFKKNEAIEFRNSTKVLNAFQKFQISEAHLNGTTGYGYNDLGREAIEKIYAEIFESEEALVRMQFISGTHTISTVLFGLLRPGDTVLSINGKPYDTLDEVIGIRENPSSLGAFGVKYEQIDLVDNQFDLQAIRERVSKKDIKLVMIQRSRGYAYRNAFLIEQIEEAIRVVKEASPSTLVMVDNCYGEFTEDREPTSVGADVAVGSLIKNIGGGIAPTGGYIVGKKEVVDLISDRYSAPGLGKEGGATFDFNRKVLQGLFMAPHVVTESKKVGIFAARLLEKLGYVVSPKYDEKRADIVEMIQFHDPDKLIKFCQGIQYNSAIDSHVTPEPWDMPGYDSKIIMASGSFTSGSSIELSCDGPVRPPYVAYLQGGLTYTYGKIAVINAVKMLGDDKK